jgi:hypothetical protein
MTSVFATGGTACLPEAGSSQQLESICHVSVVLQHDNRCRAGQPLCWLPPPSPHTSCEGRAWASGGPQMLG